MRRILQVIGFHFATLDVREHSDRHHEALTTLFAANDVDYASLTATERCTLLAAEMESRRPLAPPRTPDDAGARRDVDARKPCFHLVAQLFGRVIKSAIRKGSVDFCEFQCAQPAILAEMKTGCFSSMEVYAGSAWMTIELTRYRGCP